MKIGCEYKSLVFTGKEMLQKLDYRVRPKSDKITDVYDGLLYKTHFDDDGYLRGQAPSSHDSEVHISLQLNTDGVAVFKSSKISLWPLYATINELPPELR